MAEVTIKLDSPISIVDKGTPSTTNLPNGSIALEKDKNNNLKIYGNVGNEVVDIERVDALDNGDVSASFVAGRNLKVNGWEFYWKDVWEESEPSAIKHIESAGVNAAINEIKGTGADVSAFTFPTTKDEFIAYLKTITFDFSNQPNQVSGYGSVTYGIMNKNAGTTTIVEGMGNAVPNKIHRSHIEGQHMTFPDVEYAMNCHVEGQGCNIVGYASICHLEGNSNATVHSMNPNAGFWEEAVGCHVEGDNNVVGGEDSHAEGQYNAALGTASHCEGKGFYKYYITDWKQRTYRDNDYIVSKWKETLLGKKEGETEFHYKFSAAIAPFSHIEGMGNITERCNAIFPGLDTGVKTVFINGSNHAEGVGNYNGGAASHVEGIRNEINKDAYASHAEGIKNTTKNRAEHASGQYNKSNKATDTFGDVGNTLFSVGCGTSDANRKNAFEVMQDGTCKYLDVATGEQIDVGVAKELSKPFDLTIGSTTKKVDGKSAVSFDAVELGIQDKSNTYIIGVSSGTPEIILNVNEEVDSVEEYIERFKHVATSNELGFDGIFNLNCTLHRIYGDDDSNALLDLTGVGRLADRIVKIFLEYKTVYNSSSNTYKLLDQPERYSIKQFENYELVLSDYTTIDTTNSILPTTKAGWIALRNEPDLPIILKLSIGTYKCVGVTETSGVYRFEFILNNQDAQSQFGVYKLIVDTSTDTITQTVEYIDRMPKQHTVNAFNGALIQNLTTASTEADIRKAFTEVNAKTVLFPTPGSIISKLDGGNKGIVVSLSEPDATTLGRTITVYHGNDTYAIIVKSDFTKVLMPWTEIHDSKKIYDEKLLSLGDTTDVAQIKKAFTPKGYAQPVIPDNGDILQTQTPEGGFLIFSSVQNDEFYLYIYAPQTTNLIISIQCRKDFTTAKTSRGVIRMSAYQYDGQALLSTEITTPSDIELLYTPADNIYGYKSLYGAEPPKVGDIIIMLPTKTSENVARGIVVEAVETDNTYITRWFYGGKLYEAEVTKDFTSIPKYSKVIYDTTSGTLRDLYISAGAVYNERTGYYELNGLTDITEEEMRVIYKYAGTPQTRAAFAYSKARTNLPMPGMYNGGLETNMFYGCSNLEVAYLGNRQMSPSVYDEPFVSVDGSNSFYLCQKLKKIYGKLMCYSPNINWDLTFGECFALEEVRIASLNSPIKLSWSPNLSKESVLYMITNAKPQSGAAVGSITITLHPTAYARLKDDADIVAALEAKGGIVILVSA